MLFMPVMSVLWFYVILAVAPALLLLRYVYGQDKIEKEPGWLLRKLFFRGVLSAFLAMVLEGIGSWILSSIGIDSGHSLYPIISSFFVIATSEEWSKYLLMRRVTWKSPDFNYRFDAIVYAVTTSLGFAAMENVLYAFNYGPSVLLARALLSIPGHCAFGVIYGVHYGKAKEYASYGEEGRARSQLRKGLLLAVFFHGMYDACALTGTSLSMLLFAIVVILIYVTLLKTVKKESREDIPV